MNEECKRNLKDYIPVIMFTMWNCASFIAIVLFSQVNQLYSVMVAGQYFCVYGLIVLLNKKQRNAIGLVFVLIGLGCVILPLLSLNPNLLPKGVDPDKVVFALLCSCFVIAGIVLLFGKYIKRLFNKFKYTYKTKAEVVEITEFQGVYIPTYIYQYNGKVYRMVSKNARSYNIPGIGDIITAYVNPKEPLDIVIYDKEKKPFFYNVIKFTIGISFIAFGSFALYGILFKIGI